MAPPKKAGRHRESGPAGISAPDRGAYRAARPPGQARRDPAAPDAPGGDISVL